MPRLLYCVLLLATALPAQNPSDPTSTSLSGLVLGNNPDCSGIPRHWQWPLPPNACYRASVLGILGERELLPARAPFSYVTGHTDVATGREIALLSASNGLVIVDADRISETGPTRHRPQHIVHIDPSPPSIHRGTAAFGEYIYESNLFRPYLRVMRLVVSPAVNPPMALVPLPNVPLPAGASYRLTVDDERGHLYVPTGAGLHIFDINGANAGAPQLLAVWRGWQWPQSTMPSFDVFLHDDGSTVRAIVSEYLTVGPTHISVLDVTNLPSSGTPVDPWTPPNWFSFAASVAGGSAAHSAWADDDLQYIYSSVGDVATVVFDLRNFTLWNVNRQLTYFETPPLMQQAGTNPAVTLTYPELPLRQMGMLGLGMTGYSTAWAEGFRLYDLRPGILTPNEPLAYVDTSYSSSFHPYGGPSWSFIYPGAFSVYRKQDSGVIYVGDIDNGLYFIRLNVGHVHRYGRGTAEIVNNQPLIPRITMAKAPPRAHTAAAVDPQQKITIGNLAPGRAVILMVATDGTGSGVPFPDPTSTCDHYLGGIIAAPIFAAANAAGVAEVALPPVLPSQFRLFMQAFSFAPSSIICEASSRGTWFGLAERQ